ncbi:glycosyltransferase family 2 protein [uncultured Shewanella sp.]|uniref:glycosyltransferase family 2 protein n=1 Tax=uncultured Shewanella sp. TaxID=173975 RepID=UPI00262CF7EC|nr:glycosyltransferase family 2 protein [uncultured Shewanella sp.]
MVPKVSVIMPVYNVASFVCEAITSVLNQDFSDFELLIINDCATDNSLSLCQTFTDERLVIINHEVNKGLAAARNTGIRHAKGEYLAFLDSDDAWHSHKLHAHVAHLDKQPHIGISFSRSAFMDFEGNRLNIYQMPKLTHIDAAHLLCRNPVGNGSAPVIRKQTFDEVAFKSEVHSPEQWCYFDESFRQSEDIECWLRIIATTQWQIEGLASPLTYYRLNNQGLSSNFDKQLASWEKMIKKARQYAPNLLKNAEDQARAYQLRYLARQAIRCHDGKTAVQFINRALTLSPAIMKNEAGRTLATFTAAYLLYLIPLSLYKPIERAGHYCIGRIQKYKIKQENQ